VGLDGLSLFITYVNSSHRVIQVKRGLDLPSTTLNLRRLSVGGTMQYFYFIHPEYVNGN